MARSSQNCSEGAELAEGEHREEFAHRMSLPSRLPNLSHEQLVEIAVHGCESSPELKNKADALIAKVA